MSTHPHRPSPQPERDPAWHGMNLLDTEVTFRDDPYPALRHCREVAPVNETPVGLWRLFRHADCVHLLRDVRCGVRHLDGRLPRVPEDRAGPAEFMLQQDPPNHTRLRKLVSKAFTPRATERLRPRVQAIADELLDRVAERASGGAGELDAIADLALPVPSTLICEMMGVPVEDRDRFTSWTADATHGLAGDLAPPEVRARAEAGALHLANYFSSLIEDRRKHLGDDLVSVLIRAEEDGDRLSTSELLIQCIGLLIAGFETTIGLIGNGTATLIRHPDELAKLQADPGLIESAVEECLRYEGPIALTTRVLHEDAEFGGRFVPRDTEVWAMIWSANRDPERFPDPDRFDIERRDNAHLAFGGGTHACLGMHLARMEGQVAIGALARRFRSLALVRDEVEWSPSLFRVPAQLPVRFELA